MLVVLTVKKLTEYDFWQGSVKFHVRMDMTIRVRIIYKVKHRYAIRLKFRDKFLSSLTKLVLEARLCSCSTLKEKLLLYCRTFLAIVIVVIT